MASLAPPPRFRAFTAGSATSPVKPLAMGWLYTYETGTLTPKDTYTDAGGGTANPNPVPLDARGEADVWLGLGAYKYIYKDANFVQQGDPVNGIKGLEQWLLEAGDITDALRTDLTDESNAAKGAGLVAFSPVPNYVAGTLGLHTQQWATVFDFMTDAEIAAYRAGTYLASVTTKIQQAVTVICGASQTLLFPTGAPVIDTPITFPNTSWRVIGHGPTDTAISPKTAMDIVLFDLSGCNGPSIHVDGISFNGPIGNVGTPLGTGVYCDDLNGLVLRNCWFRGLKSGVRKTDQASYVHVLDCVAEFCTAGIEWDAAVQCAIKNMVFYRCTTDAYFTGDLDFFNWIGSSHGETTTYGVRLVGASRGNFSHLSFRQDFAAYTPTLIEMEGASAHNQFDIVTTKGFGAKVVRMAGSGTCNNNKVRGIRATGAVAIGIEIATGNTDNYFSGTFDGLGTAVVVAGDRNNFRDLDVINSTTSGISIQGADECEFSRVRLAGNFVDWSTSGTVPTVWVDEVDGSAAGLTPTRLGSWRGGVYGRTFYGSAAPSALAYLRGDRVLNVSPTVGQPKAWACTVSGTPGTWVSEGVL